MHEVLKKMHETTSHSSSGFLRITILVLPTFVSCTEGKLIKNLLLTLKLSPFINNSGSNGGV